MCTDESSYSTICGPRVSIEQLIEVWSRLATAERLGLGERGPTLIDLSGLDPVADRFRDPTSPAVAVLEHSIGLGISLTAQLQAELMVGNDHHHVSAMPELLCEPGYRFHGTQAGPGGSPQFRPGKLDDLMDSVPSVPHGARAQGPRVALLDTGLDSRIPPPWMIDFTDSVHGVRGPVHPSDDHGHGSAMAEVIRAVNPAAAIYPVRVLDHRNEGESYEVLAGLQYALYSGEFDCVSASLSSPVGSACDSSLGKSVDWTAAYCRNRTPTLSIPIIAAAGNDRGRPSGYPARLSAAVVVLAVDRFGCRASYNSQPPTQATIMDAYGGDPTDPLGEILHGDGTSTTPLYGTSLAAAAVAGAHLP